MTESVKIGRIVCATIVCPNVQKATKLYSAALGFLVIETGTVSAELAESWGAEKMAGAAYALLGPKSGAESYLRFIENPNAKAPTPYLTAGWGALEFTVESSDDAVARLLENDFKILGEAEDLSFSEGALRAGQVLGPYGEVLYLTQINRQIENFVLPHSKSGVDKMFIVILANNDVEKTTEYFVKQHNAVKKDTFEAPVEFISDFHGIDQATVYYVGTVALEDENYIELDGMPTAVEARAYEQGYLPDGIAMMTFETDAIGSFESHARGAVATSSSAPYNAKQSMTFNGSQNEWIELVEA